MKLFKLLQSKYVLIPLVILILVLAIAPYRTNLYNEPFVEGVCTSVTQTELQTKIMDTLNQPVVDSKNAVVDTNTVLTSLKTTINDGTYEDCEQINTLKSMLKNNISSPVSAISSIKSYYSTKTNK